MKFEIEQSGLQIEIEQSGLQIHVVTTQRKTTVARNI